MSDQDFHDQAVLDNIERQGSAGRDFVSAIWAARRACEEAGLNAVIDDQNRPRYTTNQIARAARFTREDVSAALILQMHIMRRLDRNLNYMIVVLLFLADIAWQIK